MEAPIFARLEESNLYLQEKSVSRKFFYLGVCADVVKIMETGNTLKKTINNIHYWRQMSDL